MVAVEDYMLRVLERYRELEHEIEEEVPAPVPLLISTFVHPFRYCCWECFMGYYRAVGSVFFSG